MQVAGYNTGVVRGVYPDKVYPKLTWLEEIKQPMCFWLVIASCDSNIIASLVDIKYFQIYEVYLKNIIPHSNLFLKISSQIDLYYTYTLY